MIELQTPEPRAAAASAFVAILRELRPELAVSTRAAGAASQLPAVRVTLIADRTPTAPWATATAQLDVWAATPVAAEDLAGELDQLWRSLVRGSVGDAFFSGAWVEQSPRPLPDPETEASRYFLEVGLLLHALETQSG